jgi:hypothetical protein
VLLYSYFYGGKRERESDAGQMIIRKIHGKIMMRRKKLGEGRREGERKREEKGGRKVL